MFSSYSFWQRKSFFVIVSMVIGSILGVITLVAVGLPTRTSILIFIGVLAPFIAIISGNTKYFLLFVLILDISLNIDINLGYDPNISGDPNGYIISVENISLVILYAIWLGELLIRRSKPPKFFPEMSIPMLGLIGSSLLSFVNSVNITYSTYEVIQLCELYLVFFYIANHIREKKDVKLILKALLWGLIIQSTIVLLQILTKTNFDLLGNIGDVEAGLFRPAGTFGHANAVAGYVAPLLVVCIGLYLSRTTIIHKSLPILALVLGLATLAATLSRGGWIAFLMGLWILVIGNIRYQRLRISPDAVMIGIISVVIVAMIFGSSIIYRVTNDYAPILSRIPLMTISFNMIKAHPFLGVGTNNFGLVMAQYTQGVRPGSWLNVVHSKYLLTWAETGIFGFFFFLWFLFSMYQKGFQTRKLDKPFYSALALGLLAGLSGYVIHMFGDIYGKRGLALMLWVLAAFFTGIDNLAQRDNHPEDQTLS